MRKGTHSGRKFAQPPGGVGDSNRRAGLLLPEGADQLHGLGVRVHRCEPCQGAVWARIGLLALDQMREALSVADHEIHFGVVLRPDVVKARRLPERILPMMDVLEQHRGHGVFEPHAVVAADKARVEEVDLRRFQESRDFLF
jgi:hypothetical protein